MTLLDSLRSKEENALRREHSHPPFVCVRPCVCGLAAVGLYVAFRTEVL